ncbi:MAG: VWA domain-containing protein [Oligoflexales bacterium]
MVFENQNYLHLLWFIPILILLSVGEWQYRKRRLQKLATAEILASLSSPVSKLRFSVKKALLAIMYGLLVFALAGPKWGFTWRTASYTGADIVVALDVSSSMLATDVNPNRLERAKREIKDLLNLLRGDRVALVVFAGTAFVQCPLTSDYSIINLFLDNLTDKTLSESGTSLADALQVATKSLTSGADRSTSAKSVILLTDGEAHKEDLDGPINDVVKNGIKVFAIGLGTTDGAPIPEEHGGFKRDKDGNIVISKLDAKTLTGVAIQTGGIFVESSASDSDLEKILASGVKPATNSGEIRESKEKVWEDRYYLFAGVGLLLAVGEFLLPLVRRKS